MLLKFKPHLKPLKTPRVCLGRILPPTLLLAQWQMEFFGTKSTLDPYCIPLPMNLKALLMLAKMEHRRKLIRPLHPSQAKVRSLSPWIERTAYANCYANRCSLGKTNANFISFCWENGWWEDVSVDTLGPFVCSVSGSEMINCVNMLRSPSLPVGAVMWKHNMSHKTLMFSFKCCRHHEQLQWQYALMKK